MTRAPSWTGSLQGAAACAPYGSKIARLPRVVPVASNWLAMLTGYINPEQRFIACWCMAAVMKQVPSLPGEEALYAWIDSVLDAAAKDPEIMTALKETAVAAEREMITPFLQWRYNGRDAGNGWNSPVNNAEWGTDYLNLTGTAKSNMYDNRPEETKYIYTDNDSQRRQLDGVAHSQSALLVALACPIGSQARRDRCRRVKEV